ncbi:transcriptional regulator [Variovorax sp. J2P1-59]|uniref:transcriptional regulator n=1 Tax=Variovorax flavidus TaxID=3053501 RepID=UPI002575B417|nr:transcriptional regulator [Variovorax sp. J2P1-59]MDM0075251.1 transcriptional regulator [Variovorax sp. J2P1-59]
MADLESNLPNGNFPKTGTVVRSTAELGQLIRQRRRALQLKQLDIAGLGNTGNRFIVELEGGKPTVQLQKALDVLGLLGLEVVVRPRDSGGM